MYEYGYELYDMLSTAQKMKFSIKYFFSKCDQSVHKKWSFPLKISSVNVSKSAGDGFGHIH